MRISDRLNRAEQAAHAKLQGLLTPKAVLDERSKRVNRMLEYIGLPYEDDDKARAFRYDVDEQLARISLASGVDRKTAHARWYAQREGLTEDEARAWLVLTQTRWGEAERDIRAGIPFEQSQAGVWLRESIISKSVLGTIVVNTHLARYGLYSLSFLRVNYITAGFWTLIPIVVPFFVLFIGWLIISRPFFYRPLRNLLNKKQQKKLEVFPIALFISLLISYGSSIFRLAYFIREFGDINGILPDMSWETAFRLGTIIAGTIFSGILLLVYRKPLKFNLGEDLPAPATTGFTIVLAAFFVPVLVLFAIMFGLRNYSTIPSHLGGGKPTKAQLVVEIAPHVGKLLDDCGLHFEEGTEQNNAIKIISSADLLLVTSEEYIIRCESGGSMSIPRSSVKSIFYKTH
jgi:hypothetical protein